MRVFQMKGLKVIIFLTLLMLCAVFGYSQEKNSGAKRYNFKSSDRIGQIPFPADPDYIIIEPTINGKSKVRLILDTGMPMPGLMLINRGKTDEWGLNFGSKISVPDGGQNFAEGVSLAFPGLELINLTAMVVPADGAIGKMLPDVDGIIGYEIFSQFTVIIDYDKQNISLMEPDKYQIPNGAEKLPLMLRNGFPWLVCSATMANGAIVPMELVIDIGAAHDLSLNVGTDENIVPPDNAIETSLGETVSGPILGKVGRIKSLRLGNMTLNNVVTSFQTGPRHGPSAMEKQGNLGNGVLRKFTFAFDYANERLILVPNSHFNEPFEYNMSGIECSRMPNRQLKVSRIIPGSPGNKTELRVGDIISTINGKSTADIGKGELRAIFRKEGETVRLVALSPENMVKNVTIILRRVI
jgi:hypothetical protein